MIKAIVTAERLREHADNLSHGNPGIYPVGPILDAANEIERLRDDPFRLPFEALPDGWLFDAMCFFKENEEHRRYIVDIQSSDDNNTGTGATPRAAMLAAIERIGNRG